MTEEVASSRSRALAGRSQPFEFTPFDRAFYTGSRALIWLFAKFYNRLEIIGAENIPKTGPALLVANHASDLDPLLVSLMAWRPIVGIGKIELWDNPALAWALERYHAIPVRRSSADRRALTLAIEALREGRLVTIFPEGARTRTGALMSAKPGAGLIWAKTQAPMVPIYADGTFEAKPIGSRGIAPVKIRLVAGKAVDFPLASASAADYERLSEFMMRRIAALKATLPN